MEEKENYLEHFDIIKEKDESKKSSNLKDLKEEKTKKKMSLSNSIYNIIRYRNNSFSSYIYYSKRQI